MSIISIQEYFSIPRDSPYCLLRIISWPILLGKRLKNSAQDRRSIYYIYLFSPPPRKRRTVVAIKRQKDFGSLHVGPLTVIPFHGMARMTRSRSLLASILGGFVSSDRWRAGPSSRLDNDDPAAPFPQIPYLSTTSTPFATHDERPCFPGPRLPFPLFFSTISLSLSLCFPRTFSSGTSPRPIATRHPRPHRGGLEKIAQRTAQFPWSSNSRIIGHR